MMIAGWLFFRQQLLGGWLYIAIVALTVIWAFWEVGANGCALVPRVIAPLVLLIAVLLVMPSLTVAANRWRLAWGGIAAVIVLTVITGFTLGYINRHRVLAALPPATADMPDPALMRSEEHTSELQSLMRISYAVFCLKKKKHDNKLR